MPLTEARRIISADYRPPIRRGDLEELTSGQVAGIIDGVFDQDLAVSLTEVRDALDRGVVIFGGGSMGALRAAEVPGVHGIGQVYQWYRTAAICRDDEVALLFDPLSGRALTVPTVNVRFAVERLCSLGTLDRATGDALVQAALRLSFRNRTYAAILEAAGLATRRDSEDLIAMLSVHDVKYRDAQAVLEVLARRANVGAPASFGSADRTRADEDIDGTGGGGDAIQIWESGDRARAEELYVLLAATGRVESYVDRALARDAALMTADRELAFDTGRTAQEVLLGAVRRWGWKSSAETKVTLADLALPLDELDAACKEEVAAAARRREVMRRWRTALHERLPRDLFLDGLALKREVMRWGGLVWFAGGGAVEPTATQRAEAEAALCRVNGVLDRAALHRRWDDAGLDATATHAFVSTVARARQHAAPLARAMRGEAVQGAVDAVNDLSLRSCPKAPGESRFCRPPAAAETEARRLGDAIGVTRIGMIGELADLGGLQIAQAARPGGAWSSSYGSGKGQTAAGAVVGSVMEEIEKWAQEHFTPAAPAGVLGSYDELRSQGGFVDPATLDLPFDSGYDRGQPLRWYRCHDLLEGGTAYLPLDAIDMRQGVHDIYFSRRGARKHLATNGLGSGFSLEEAILHGLCEYVERHAQRLAEMFLSNPGIGDHPYRFVDLRTASPQVQDIAARLTGPDSVVRVLDITSDVRIPSFVATITRQRRADGYGTHPEPDTAIAMALLEAAQTLASATAGAREDLSIRARSLGRHERPRPFSAADAWFWLDRDAVLHPVDRAAGYTSADVYDDLRWCLRRVGEAGLDRVLVHDLSHDAVAPARVVRVIVPGLETNNPFYTGPRARLVLLRDLLPRWR